MRRLLALGIIALLALSALAAPDWTKEKKAGDEALKRKDYETAIRIFELLTRAYPEKIDGFNALGFAYFMNKDNERAVYTFKQALALNPNNPSAQHNLILAVTEQANQDCRDLQYTEAVSLLRGILSSYPNHPETANVYFLLGKVEFYRGGEDQGIADWREVAPAIFGIDVAIEPERAKAMHASHLARERWMTEVGYAHLLSAEPPLNR